MRTFASSAVNLAKLPHIFLTIWRPPKTAPSGVAGAPGALLRHWFALKHRMNSGGG